MFVSRSLIVSSWQLCIDANGAWNPEGCMEMLKVLAPLSEHIYMLEQPFPTTLLKVRRWMWCLLLCESACNDSRVPQRSWPQEPSEASSKAWRDVKAAYEQARIPIFADESMSTAADLPFLVVRMLVVGSSELQWHR
jgi:L-alanine-DL-glutamate epimerase-like enolase superfamily enzyme